MSLIGPKLKCRTVKRMSDGIVLQNSKVAAPRIFAKTRSGRRSPIRIPSVAVPKSPVSLTREGGNE